MMEGWQSKRMYQSLIGNVQREALTVKIDRMNLFQSLIGNVQLKNISQ